MRHPTMLCALLGVLVAGPSQAASPFDGVYTGSTSWAGNGNRRCTGAVADFKVTVRDGQFSYGGGGNRVPVSIEPDGSFSATSGQRFLRGKITGNALSASTSGTECNYLWDLHR